MGGSQEGPRIGVTRWTVQFTKKAVDELGRLNRSDQIRITAAIDLLRSHPFPPRAVKLSGRDDYRVGVGDYRIIYSVDGLVKTVLIIREGHRREVYRR